MAPKKTKTAFNFPHPMEAESLVGHADAMKRFQDAWDKRDTHPIHPVWMLAGPRGIGKATMVYKIASTVYGNVGDFFIIDLDNNFDDKGALKKDAKQISIATVTRMIERMHMSSMSGQWRVILIDAVDELSRSAANAILKLLEEPPAQTLFLLVVHQLSNVLPTIRSRARVEKLHPLTISELRQLCARFMGDVDISTDILKLASGSFGKIATLKKSGGDAIYEDLLTVLNNPRANSGDVMAVAKKIAVDAELWEILLDAVAHFGLADLYSWTVRAIGDMRRVNLEPEIGIFKIIMEIKRCL